MTIIVGGECDGYRAPIGDMIGLPGLARQFIHELIPFKYYPDKHYFLREQVNELLKDKFSRTVDWHTWVSTSRS